MSTDLSEIFARKAKRLREEEEDNRLLAENAADAAAELKASLESIAHSTGQHVLSLLGYDRDTVIKWANNQKTPLFMDADEENKFNDEVKNKYLGKTVQFKNDKGKDEEAKIGDRGRPKGALIAAWRDGREISVKN